MKTCRCYSLAAAAAVIAFPACAVRTLPPPTAAAAAPLFANAVADVARMERDSNEARFEAVTAMLKERGIAFEVEPFTIEPHTREPRTQGRNVVVTIAGRTPEIVVGAHYDAARLADGTLSKGAVDNAASAVILVLVSDERQQEVRLADRIYARNSADHPHGCRHVGADRQGSNGEGISSGTWSDSCI